MNYFEFYDIPVSFTPELTAIRKQYYANSKKYHPDFYTMESEEKKAEILQLASLNNEAYKTLSDEDLRMKYILETENILTAENKTSIPPDFLMEMMDINEQLMELEFDYDEKTFQSAATATLGIENQLHNDIKVVLSKTSIKDCTATELLSIKNYYLKKRYILRIQEKLSTFASR